MVDEGKNSGHPINYGPNLFSSINQVHTSIGDIKFVNIKKRVSHILLSGTIVGKVPTRQSLNAHTVIREAFIVKKQGLKVQGPHYPMPSNLVTAAERIARLQSQVDKLKMRNSNLKEQFVVWQYNAYKHGLKEYQLNAPLPRIDRERTED